MSEWNLGACEAIVAEFVYGPMRCGADSIAEATDATWGTVHPVCELHMPEADAVDGAA